MSAPPPERVRTLLLRADNLLKAGKPDRPMEALVEAEGVAAGGGVETRGREPVTRRIDGLRPMLEGHATDQPG